MLSTDASLDGCGGILIQKVRKSDGTMVVRIIAFVSHKFSKQIIAFVSHKFSKQAKAWATIEQEHIVEEVRNHRFEATKRRNPWSLQLQIKWLGYGEGEKGVTWEPYSKIKDNEKVDHYACWSTSSHELKSGGSLLYRYP